MAIKLYIMGILHRITQNQTIDWNMSTECITPTFPSNCFTINQKEAERDAQGNT